jgi:hypothetical protein
LYLPIDLLISPAPGSRIEEKKFMSVQAAMSQDVLTHRAPVYSICDAPGFADRLEETNASAGEGVRCVKGLVIAIALEAAAALCILTTWHAWHILR